MSIILKYIMMKTTCYSVEIVMKYCYNDTDFLFVFNAMKRHYDDTYVCHYITNTFNECVI